ncbi:T9SS type A sorting domain-containing protein [Candidatus Marinimicrobia bacterium MT.SAG.2]|nr:T9SS type A sorting domain-containing protein [Candidatus Marinimicrobia bacterium MT.SAG.2]
MQKITNIIALTAFLLFAVSSVFGQNLMSEEMAGFEGGIANYFAKDAGGATLTWATDDFRTANYSLKIEKTGTGTASRWVAGDLYRYWSVGVAPDVAMEIGGWVKTSGVNTSPASDAEKIQLKFTFFTAGVDILGAPVVLDVDQTSATSAGWMEVKNDFALAPSQTADSIRVEFVFGSGATGTAWLDDIFIRATGDGWAGDFFNPNVDAPTGWFYWWADFSAGKSEWDTSVDYVVSASDAFAHSGTYSAYIEGQAGRTNDFFISTDIMPIPNEPLVISAWMKGVGLTADLTNDGPDTWATGFKIGWHNVDDGRDAWGHFAEDNRFFTVPGDTFDWTPFATVVTPPEGAIGLSLRLWVGKEFLGATYWDDVAVTPLSQMTNEMPEVAAGLEGGIANYFAKDAGGATLTWATDDFRTANYSLKIEKTGTGTASRWVAGDLYRYWSVGVAPDVAMEIGGWVKTSGVNTSPASDAEKIQLKFTFFTAGVDILGAPVVLDVDQTSATSAGWMEVKNDFALAPSQTADSIRVEFVFGSGATGTAWLDDIFIRATGDGWAGDFFNPNVDAPTGWFYWWADFSAGKSEWDTSVDYVVSASDAFAHSGTYSAYIEGQAGRTNDFFISTDIMPIPNEPLVISAWMKGVGLTADLTNDGPDTWATGFKIGWHNVDDGRDAWGHFAEDNRFFTVPGDTFDWTPFATVVTPPEGAIGLSLRLWVGKEFLGATYWDDVVISKLGGPPPVGVVPEPEFLASVPKSVELLQNYPNPFNPSTIIRYGVPKASGVKVEIFNLLGQHVITLVDRNQIAGTYEVTWNGNSASGNIVTGGMYFYRLRIGDTALTKKMLLLK